MAYAYHRRVLRPDSPALTNYEATAKSPMTLVQQALLKQLRAEGSVPLTRTHAMTLAALVRRNLARFDETHAYPVEGS